MTHGFHMGTVGVGILGLGFMGRTHLRAFEAARAAGYPCEVRAVCDRDVDTAMKADTAGNIAGTGSGALFDAAKVRLHSRVENLLADEAVDLVVIGTYTDTHVEFASRALAAGKHVLVEKPLALSSGEAHGLLEIAEAQRIAVRPLLCMPAMCIRFWPAYAWLKTAVESGEFGAVRSATFQRLGSGPSWGGAFYRDDALSGGAMFDLHVHDADFVYWTFGRPAAVMSAGSLNHVTTLYRYNSTSAPIAAEGAWDLAPGSGFRMRFLVNFERATAEFAFGAKPELMLHQQAGTREVELVPGLGYDHQARHMIDTITKGVPLRATVREAVEVLRVVEAERRSQRTGRAVEIK